MAEGKGTGGRAFAFLSGLAAVATVIAAAVAILAQFGLIASHDTPKTVVVTVSPAAVPSIAALPPPGAPIQSAQPSVARVAASPRPHHVHPKPTPEQSEVAGVPPPSKPRAETIALANAPEASKPSVAVNSAPAQSPAAANTLAMVDRSQLGSIGGAWRDGGIGACHLISQTGNKFQVWNYDPATGELMGQGEGSIDGNHVQIDFPRGRHPVTMDLHIAPSGDVMFGKIIRVDGIHRAMWNYLGATCPKPG
ncbi:MAG TPA: hypothetical protein VMH37_04055 [Candidatus Binataceae bacterium]|nr:hypothetical protein [Candidatus Binataceae bacterium]